MPVRYICKHCGYVLFEFKRVGQDYNGIPTPEEIYRTCGGICPKCKSTLEIPRKDYSKIILIRPYTKPYIFTPMKGTATTTVHA